MMYNYLQNYASDCGIYDNTIINNFYDQFYIYQTALYGSNNLYCPVYNQYEVFLPHPIYNKYLISDHGQVYSLYNNRLSSHTINNLGYHFVYILDIHRNRPIHRLIKETFEPIFNSDILEVDHIDCNPGNNCLWNLRWVTHNENMKYAKENGLMSRGEDRNNAILTNIQVQEICELMMIGISIDDIIMKLGLSDISNIKKIIISIKNNERYNFINMKYIYPDSVKMYVLMYENERIVDIYAQLLSTGIAYRKIAELTNAPWGKHFINMMLRIKRGKLYPNIASKYGILEPKII